MGRKYFYVEILEVYEFVFEVGLTLVEIARGIVGEGTALLSQHCSNLFLAE